MKPMTRKQVEDRLRDIHAQMFLLGEEAKQLGSYLHYSSIEDHEKAQVEKRQEAAK